MVAKLEADLDAIDGKNLKEDNKNLKEEIDRLKGELEHRALKGDFNIDSKILHFKMNPATVAYEQAEHKQKALLEEVEKLRAIVATGKFSEAPVSSLQAQGVLNYNFFFSLVTKYDIFIYNKIIKTNFYRNRRAPTKT